MVEAVLPLHCGVVGRGRSGPAKATRVSQVGEERPGMEASLKQRRHLHAGQVGVPLGEQRVNDRINVSKN